LILSPNSLGFPAIETSDGSGRRARDAGRIVQVSSSA
jgi:hypothetical protein